MRKGLILARYACGASYCLPLESEITEACEKKDNRRRKGTANKPIAQGVVLTDPEYGRRDRLHRGQYDVLPDVDAE